MEDQLHWPPVRCQKCRYHLLDSSDVVDSHGVGFDPTSGPPSPSNSCSTDVWYIPENKMPDWMKSNVESGDWVKGKMTCPKCQARIGSYNFVSGMKCTCGLAVLPPIHIVKSKVDIILPPPLPQLHHFSGSS